MATRLSDSDMAVAAACASGDIYKALPQHQQRKPRARSVRTPIPEEEIDLPNIDDLQIAAGAAAGKKDPVWPVLRKALGQEDVSDEESEGGATIGEVGAEQGDEDMLAASSEDEDKEAEIEEESSEAESSETSSSSSNEDLIDRADRPARQTDQHVDVGLEVDANGHVRLQFAPSPLKDPAEDMEELRAELDHMQHGGEDADDARMEQGVLPPVVEPLDVDVLPDDVLLPVGSVSAVVGPTIVVQAPENGRAVSEGTPLCLGDRQLVGRVEDVFGPVMEPLYSLRYACGPQMPSNIAVGTQIFCIQRLTEYILPQELYVKGYDKAEEDAESEVEEDDDADEVEFSDDESEAAWRRQQRAAETPKRRMHQSGPSYVIPNGSERGRGRSQRGRFDGQGRGQGRGRMQGRDGGERGRGRGHSGSSRGRGNLPSGRAAQSAPFQIGQGQHSRNFNGNNPQLGNYGNLGTAQQMANQHAASAHQQQGGHPVHSVQQQLPDNQMPYSASPYQQQQQPQQPFQHHLQQQQRPFQQQQQQQPFQQQQQAPRPFQQSSMPSRGQYMQPPPGGQSQQLSWNHQNPMQQPMQGISPVSQNMQQSYAPMNTQSQPRNHQQPPYASPHGQQQMQQQHALPAPQQWPQQQKMPGSYQGQLPQYHGQLPQQQHQQHFQEQQHAVPICYTTNVSPQQLGQPHLSYQGLSSPPSAGVASSPATNAYLARLHGRPSKPGNGAGR